MIKYNTKSFRLLFNYLFWDKLKRKKVKRFTKFIIFSLRKTGKNTKLGYISNA